MIHSSFRNSCLHLVLSAALLVLVPFARPKFSKISEKFCQTLRLASAKRGGHALRTGDILPSGTESSSSAGQETFFFVLLGILVELVYV